MEITYDLTGGGWARASVSDGTANREMRVTYLSDALADIARAALELLRGARDISFSFQDEPGEHRWLLKRGEADTLHVRVLRFEDTFSTRTQGGLEVFYSKCTVMDFVGQVCFVLQNILERVGLEGYRKLWRNSDFPLDTFNELQRRL
jgi:hypothetical protein